MVRARYLPRAERAKVYYKIYEEFMAGARKVDAARKYEVSAHTVTRIVERVKAGEEILGKTSHPPVKGDEIPVAVHVPLSFKPRNPLPPLPFESTPQVIWSA